VIGAATTRDVLVKQCLKQTGVYMVNVAYKTIIDRGMYSFVRLHQVAIRRRSGPERITAVGLQLGHNIFIDVSRIHHRNNFQSFGIGDPSPIDHLLFNAHLFCEARCQLSTPWINIFLNGMEAKAVRKEESFEGSSIIFPPIFTITTSSP
jgi:hypothetical protein